MAPENAGSEPFSQAVADFFSRQFESMGGSARVVIDDQAQQIVVTWSLKPNARDPRDVVPELLKAGQLKRAIPLLWTLIQKTPTDWQNYDNIGVAYNERGDFDKSKVYLQQAIKLAPKDVNSLAALGFAQIKTNELAAAAETLQTAVGVDPSNLHALKNLAGCLLNLGRFEEAEPILRRAVHIAPQDVQSVFGLAQALENWAVKRTRMSNTIG